MGLLPLMETPNEPSAPGSHSLVTGQVTMGSRSLAIAKGYAMLRWCISYPPLMRVVVFLSERHKKGTDFGGGQSGMHHGRHVCSVLVGDSPPPPPPALRVHLVAKGQ